MTEQEQRRPPKAIRAASRFFVRVGQAQTAAKVYDEYTQPLFPLLIIMECEKVGDFGCLEANRR